MGTVVLAFRPVLANQLAISAPVSTDGPRIVGDDGDVVWLAELVPPAGLAGGAVVLVDVAAVDAVCVVAGAASAERPEAEPPGGRVEPVSGSWLPAPPASPGRLGRLRRAANPAILAARVTSARVWSDAVSADSGGHHRGPGVGDLLRRRLASAPGVPDPDASWPRGPGARAGREPATSRRYLSPPIR